MLPPSAFTVVVPFARFADRAMLGYGIGTGPPGDGVLHTSGMVAIEMPLLPLWHRLRPLTLIVTDIVVRLQVGTTRQPREAASWRCYSRRDAPALLRCFASKPRRTAPPPATRTRCRRRRTPTPAP